MKMFVYCFSFMLSAFASTLKAAQPDHMAESIFYALIEKTVACTLITNCQTIKMNVTSTPAAPSFPKRIFVFVANNGEDFQCACDFLATQDASHNSGVICINRRRLPSSFDNSLIGTTLHRPCLVLCQGSGGAGGFSIDTKRYPLLTQDNFYITDEAVTISNILFPGTPKEASTLPSTAHSPSKKTPKRRLSSDSDEENAKPALEALPACGAGSGSKKLMSAAGGSPGSYAKAEASNAFTQAATLPHATTCHSPESSTVLHTDPPV